MPKIFESSALARTARALLIVLLSLNLSGCVTSEDPATRPVKTRIPAELLAPVEYPAVPNPENGASDIDVAVLIQEDGKALEACNAKLEDISKLVETY